MEILPTRHLSRARDRLSIVELRRRRLEPHKLCGIVLDFSPTLVVLQVLSGEIKLDGYTIIRRRDISSFKVAENADFYSKVLKLRRLAPRRLKGIALESIGASIVSSSRHFPLVTIHPERKDPDVCYIGIPHLTTDTTLHLTCIGPDARWDPDPLNFRLSSITKIDFGGAYEEALAMASKTTGKAKRSKR